MKHLIISLLLLCKGHSVEHPARFEGVLGQAQETISNLTSNAKFFLPYNPVIVEVGGYKGDNTISLSTDYPKGQIIVFEPNPKAFSRLLAQTQGCKNVVAHNLALNTYSGTALLHLNHGVYANNEDLEGLSSLLEEKPDHHYFYGPEIGVPCVVLDEWCQQNGIDRVHFIQLDCEGFELQILQSSPEILKSVLVICTKTNFLPFRQDTTLYPDLKNYLENSGFTLLSHWYREGLQGEATFIRKYVYDALFN